MLATLAARLRCPNCREPLVPHETTLRCARGHSFDVARGGYVTLPDPRHRLAPGDTAAMVLARASFLAGGHFEPLSAALVSAARAALGDGDGDGETIVDLGAGTGHHLAALLRARADAAGIALDSSRVALRRALRADERIAAVLCDVWRDLPLASDAIDLAVNVFAPHNGPEIARALKGDGALIVVTPTAAHLEQLVEHLGTLRVGEHKRARLHSALSPALEPRAVVEVEFAMRLTAGEIEAVIEMGPTAHHLAADELRARVSSYARGGRPEVTCAVSVETFGLPAR
jgi:23S rRNA (guanine745-N1)-methyltransferase